MAIALFLMESSSLSKTLLRSIQIFDSNDDIFDSNSNNTNSSDLLQSVVSFLNWIEQNAIEIDTYIMVQTEFWNESNDSDNSFW